MIYQLTTTNAVIRLADNAIIPADPRNRDWQEYQQWLDLGNTPDPVPVPPLVERRAEAWARIKAHRDQRKAGGVLVGQHWFHSDDSSRIQQLGLVIMGANMPPGIMWKAMGNGFVEMTPTLASQIFQASAASDQAIFAVAEQHRIAMEASENPEAYNFMTGWPLAHGEA